MMAWYTIGSTHKILKESTFVCRYSRFEIIIIIPMFIIMCCAIPFGSSTMSLVDLSSGHDMYRLPSDSNYQDHYRYQKHSGSRSFEVW